jgi:exodeoxyribonuclease VII small subunit
MKNNDQNLSFEVAIQELSDITQAMEQGKLTLDQMITSYQRGLVLKKICEDRLKAAEMKIETLKKEESL